MNRTASAGVMAMALLTAVAGGYWWGTQGRSPATAPQPAKQERKLLYYRNPMGLPDTSPVPKKDSMGMDYVPVYEDEKPASQGRVLYYRNPMGLPDTSPVPKKDSMGMDYVPVYENEAAPSGQVAITPEKIQKLGVKTEPAATRVLSQAVRVMGTIQPDERRQHTVAPKFEGWIERLHVNATGQPVSRGQVLMDVYSPELVSAQQEYAIAHRGLEQMKSASEEAREGMRGLARASLERLRNWDIGDAELKGIEAGKVRRTISLRSPADGIVLERTAVAGMRFMPGEALYKLVDLSSVWLQAQVFEHDLGRVSVGQAVVVSVDAYPGRTFRGRVDFVYPTVNPETRAATARIVLPNPGGLLKPAMYARAEIQAGDAGRPVLAVPGSAVLRTGTRDVVLVELGGGRFQPREVRLGGQGDSYVEVLQGLAAGERVVVSANFLIDAESNLKGALQSFGAAQPGEAAKAAPAPAAAGAGHQGH